MRRRDAGTGSVRAGQARARAVMRWWYGWWVVCVEGDEAGDAELVGRRTAGVLFGGKARPAAAASWQHVDERAWCGLGLYGGRGRLAMARRRWSEAEAEAEAVAGWTDTETQRAGGLGDHRRCWRQMHGADAAQRPTPHCWRRSPASQPAGVGSRMAGSRATGHGVGRRRQPRSLQRSPALSLCLTCPRALLRAVDHT